MMGGCALGGNSFSVLNLKTGQAVHIRREGHKEVLLGTDDESQAFRTLYLADNHTHFIMRTIAYDGEILEKRIVLIFAREYVPVYHVRQGYALSPDGYSIAYLDERTGELRNLDVRASVSRLLVADLASNLVAVQTLKWLSDSQLLVAVDGTGKPYAQILLVDVAGGAVRVELRPARLSLLAGVQTDGTFLAYRDNSWNRKGFRIYDLQKRAEVGEIIPGPGNYANFERWAENGEARLLYIEAGKTNFPVLRQYDVAMKESRELKRWDSDSTVLICGLFGPRLFYTIEPRAGSKGSRLFLWNALTQQEAEIKGVRTDGVVTVVDHGNRLIYEWLP